jgi:hypothetical protein
MANPSSFWKTRTRIHRLARWVDGIETEFPISWSQLTDPEREQIACVLGTLCDELDDYRTADCLRTRSVKVRISECVNPEMREPAVR